MPKIIDNLEIRLMEEAKKQIEENGYGAVTIRSIAKSCGVGVGTVYNYFSSKDNLLAAYMLNDWNICLKEIESVAYVSDTPEAVARCIYDQLCFFVQSHNYIIRDEAAVKRFQNVFGQYHGILRSQLAVPLEKYCSGLFAAEFIAEALLTWTMAGKTFEDVYNMIKKCFS